MSAVRWGSAPPGALLLAGLQVVGCDSGETASSPPQRLDLGGSKAGAGGSGQGGSGGAGKGGSAAGQGGAGGSSAGSGGAGQGGAGQAGSGAGSGGSGAGQGGSGAGSGGSAGGQGGSSAGSGGSSAGQGGGSGSGGSGGSGAGQGGGSGSGGSGGSGAGQGGSAQAGQGGGPVCDAPPRVLQWVNRARCLAPCDYGPPDLETVPGTNFKLRKAASDAFVAMRAAAQQAGVSLGIQSAYRSFSTQVATFSNWVGQSGCEEAKTYSAVPGHSEHQLGDALDLDGWDLGSHQVKPGHAGDGPWLAANACKYGFVLSYPEGEQGVTGYIHEPWHWRYVGPHVAQLLRPLGAGGVCASAGPTLEEYFQQTPGAGVSGDCVCPAPSGASEAAKTCINNAPETPFAGWAGDCAPTCASGCYLQGNRATDQNTGLCAAPGSYAQGTDSSGTPSCWRCAAATSAGSTQTAPGKPGGGWNGGGHPVTCDPSQDP